MSLLDELRTKPAGGAKDDALPARPYTGDWDAFEDRYPTCAAMVLAGLGGRRLRFATLINPRDTECRFTVHVGMPRGWSERQMPRGLTFDRADKRVEVRIPPRGKLEVPAPWVRVAVRLSADGQHVVGGAAPFLRVAGATLPPLHPNLTPPADALPVARPMPQPQPEPAAAKSRKAKPRGR